jgi:hypothetical protein
MANVFDTDLEIHEKYDFKGSTVGRQTLADEILSAKFRMDGSGNGGGGASSVVQPAVSKTRSVLGLKSTDRENQGPSLIERLGSSIFRISTPPPLGSINRTDTTDIDPVEAAKNVDLSNLTLKELDFQRLVNAGHCNKLQLGSIKKEMLLKQLELDASLLRKHGFMDYSVLVGVHRKRKPPPPPPPPSPPPSPPLSQSKPIRLSTKTKLLKTKYIVESLKAFSMPSNHAQRKQQQKFSNPVTDTTQATGTVQTPPNRRPMSLMWFSPGSMSRNLSSSSTLSTCSSNSVSIHDTLPTSAANETPASYGALGKTYVGVNIRNTPIAGATVGLVGPLVMQHHHQQPQQQEQHNAHPPPLVGPSMQRSYSARPAMMTGASVSQVASHNGPTKIAQSTIPAAYATATSSALFPPTARTSSQRSLGSTRSDAAPSNGVTTSLPPQTLTSSHRNPSFSGSLFSLFSNASSSDERSLLSRHADSLNSNSTKESQANASGALKSAFSSESCLIDMPNQPATFSTTSEHDQCHQTKQSLSISASNASLLSNIANTGANMLSYLMTRGGGGSSHSTKHGSVLDISSSSSEAGKSSLKSKKSDMGDGILSKDELPPTRTASDANSSQHTIESRGEQRQESEEEGCIVIEMGPEVGCASNEEIQPEELEEEKIDPFDESLHLHLPFGKRFHGGLMSDGFESETIEYEVRITLFKVYNKRPLTQDMVGVFYRYY